MRLVRKLELLLFVFGVLLLGVYAGLQVHRAVLSRAAMEAFTNSKDSSADQPQRAELDTSAPDFSLWSPKRIREYEDSLASHFAPAVGVIRIPKLHLEAPLLEGTDDLILNRGVGRIQGTARPGEPGNIGIAGHRDGFFRGLKDVAPGDTIEMVTRAQTFLYKIDRIVIVSPGDVSVLAPRERASLTLVTCYPFYFIGSAPKRYIVQATIEDSGQAPPNGTGLSRSDTKRREATALRQVSQSANDSEVKEKNR